MGSYFKCTKTFEVCKGSYLKGGLCRPFQPSCLLCQGSYEPNMDQPSSTNWYKNELNNNNIKLNFATLAIRTYVSSS